MCIQLICPRCDKLLYGEHNFLRCSYNTTALPPCTGQWTGNANCIHPFARYAVEIHKSCQTNERAEQQQFDLRLGTDLVYPHAQRGGPWQRCEGMGPGGLVRPEALTKHIPAMNYPTPFVYPG